MSVKFLSLDREIIHHGLINDLEHERKITGEREVYIKEMQMGKSGQD